MYVVIASTVESILEYTRTVDMRTGQTVCSRVTLDHSPSPDPVRCFVTPVLTPLVCIRGVLAKLLSNYVYVDGRGQAVLESRVTRALAHCYRSKGNQFRQTVQFLTKQLVLASYSLL